MPWNYRVVRNGEDLRIYDVYYDELLRPIATHVDPTYVYGASVEDLRTQMQLMLEALDKPVLDDSEIGAGSGSW